MTYRVPFLFAFVVIACVIVGSCQKKYLSLEDSQTAVQPVVVAHDSVMRLSDFFYYTISGSLQDTFEHTEIFYDSLGRVNTMSTYFYHQGPDSLFSVTLFYYHDSESIAYEKIKRFPHATGRDTLETFFYYYDYLRRLIKDSVNYPNKVEVDTYNYFNPMITALKSYVFDNNPGGHREIDTGFLNSTGNVIKLSIWYINGAAENKITEFAYDDKQNPFYQLNIHSTFIPVLDIPDIIKNPEFALQKNNMINITETYFAIPVNTIYNTTYTYSYNAAGLPLTQYNDTWRNVSGGDWIGYLYKKM